MMKKHERLPVRICTSSRRMFLGALGASVSIPLLPSLVPEVDAQDLDYSRVLFAVWSHGVYQPLWYPTGIPMSDVPGQPGVRSGPLSAGSMSLYMDNYFDGLLDKISILRGISQIGAWGHPTPLALSCSEFKPDKRDGEPIVGLYPSSIDNVLADSSAVYGGASPAVDVLRLSLGGTRFTHSIRNFRNLNCLDSAQDAFDLLFPGGVMSPGGNEVPPPSGPSPAEAEARRRRLLVDRVLGDYQRLRGDRRIGSADQQLLDQTMDHYRDLQTGLGDGSGGGMLDTSLCSDFSVANSDSARVDDHIRLFTQGFACGATRIGYWRMRSSHSDSEGAHQASNGANQSASGLYTSRMRENSRDVGLLLRAMDGFVEANGKTMLDNSLVVFCSDLASSVYGAGGHTGIDAPFLVAGSLGGKFETGQLIDYSDMSGDGLLQNIRNYDLRGGPPHNELMISILNAFNVPASDYEVDGQPGFGTYGCTRTRECTANNYTQGRYSDFYQNVQRGRRGPGAELPFWRKGA
ncbi:MAG: DUF1552 domain-containing protein [Myxococcota bacterium]